MPNEVTFYLYDSITASVPIAIQTFSKYEWSADGDLSKFRNNNAQDIVRFKANLTNTEGITNDMELWVEIALDGVITGEREQIQWAGSQNYDFGLAAGDIMTIGSDSSKALKSLNGSGVRLAGDDIVGNEVVGTKDKTLIRSGTGTSASPYKLSLNLKNPNIWTGAQTFKTDTKFPIGVWKSTGNVGIGTTSPSERLDVAGAVKATAFVGDGSRLTGISGGDASYGSSASSPDDAVYIDDAGNVGIGTMSPSKKLNVNGDIKIDGGNLYLGGTGTQYALYRTESSSPSNKTIFFGGDEGDIWFELLQGDYSFRTNDGGWVDRLCIKHTGNVGIGTTNPTERLDVVGTVKATAFVGDGSGLTGISGGDASYGSSASSPKDAVYVDDSGNVGIGTTAPDTTLDINGYLKLAKNSSAPCPCNTSYDGALALTSDYRMCVCKDGTGWVYTSDGLTECGNWNNTHYWITKANKPTSVGLPAIASVNNKIYVITGHIMNYPRTKIVEIYDPVTDSWTAGTIMGFVRNEATATAYNGKIYVFGGYTTNTLNPSQVEVYDTASNTVISTASNMPTPRGGAVSALVNEKIYVIGGNTYSGGTFPRYNRIDEYSPLTDTWATKTNMPTARTGMAVGVVNNMIYVIGGYGESGLLSKVEVYDPSTDTWSTKLSNMPTPRFRAASVVLNNKIYVIGGEGESGLLSKVEVYDPSTDTWTVDIDMTSARSNCVAATVSDVIYVIAGDTLSDSTNKNEAFITVP